MITLRTDQSEFIDKIRFEMSKHQAVLGQAQTGFGKTIAASYICQSALNKNNSVHFIVHRKELCRQTSKTFEKFDIDHGFIASGFMEKQWLNAQICSIDTLKNRINMVKIPDLAIFDECHLGGSAGWSKVIDHYKSHGCKIIGLSATPWRLDGSGLNKHFSCMVKGSSVRWLIDNGHLSNFKYYAPSFLDLSDINVSMGDHNKSELNSRFKNDRVIIGNAVKNYKDLANGKLAIYYAIGIEHSKNIAEEFIAAGIPAAHIDGTTPDDERKRLIKLFADRKILVLTNVDLITTGFDLASQVDKDVSVEAIGLMRPTKSLSLYLQMVGRGLRAKPFPAIILDHANCAVEHGLPDIDREWSLSGREKGRKASSLSVEKCRVCEICYVAQSPSEKCYNCGHIFSSKERSIKYLDGKLEEVDPLKNAMLVEEARKSRQEVGRARTRSDLEKIARERGYKSGWIFHQMKLKGIKS
jgi:superfamily II DNA or RNA helicase